MSYDLSNSVIADDLSDLYGSIELLAGTSLYSRYRWKHSNKYHLWRSEL